jgi:hypothetical protein
MYFWKREKPKLKDQLIFPQKHSSGQINLLSSLRAPESPPESSTESIGCSSVPLSEVSSLAASRDCELSKYFCLSWLLSRVFSWQWPQWQETQIQHIRNISLLLSNKARSQNIKNNKKGDNACFSSAEHSQWTGAPKTRSRYVMQDFALKFKCGCYAIFKNQVFVGKNWHKVQVPRFYSIHNISKMFPWH